MTKKWKIDTWFKKARFVLGKIARTKIATYFIIGFIYGILIAGFIYAVQIILSEL